jgi:hypothetical protein
MLSASCAGDQDVDTVLQPFNGFDTVPSRESSSRTARPLKGPAESCCSLSRARTSQAGPEIQLDSDAAVIDAVLHCLARKDTD